MRALFALLLVALLALPLHAASLQDEARFLDAVRVAYSTTNIDAIMALQCWDGVNALDRASCPGVVAKQLRAEERGVQSVEYCSRELNHHITNNGVVYVPNLKPIRWISVQFGSHDRMSPTDVSKIIADEIGVDWGRSNLHGVDLRASLVAPERRLFSDARDASPREMWLVLEEKSKERSGYKIVFDEAEKQFGLAMPGNGRDVFLGFYGSFLDTFSGM